MKAQERLIEALGALSWSWARGKARLLLGTDEFIQHEARVALTPDHLERLGSDLRRLGIEAEMFVVSGAGERARPPFADRAYRDVGATVVSPGEAAALPAFDVVHALKEPTTYEATLTGPILRIGALHLASKPSGLCDLLRARRFAAIFDGATVGNCSYRLEDGDRTPIVGSMSRFAGAVAGRKLVEGIRANDLGPGRVVVVGGGIAGRSASRPVRPIASELVVIEPWEPMQRRLQRFLPEQGFSSFRILPSLHDSVLDGAIGLVFAHRSGAQAA
ncbi:MAG: hypothetical protein MI919_10215, partial [Holophagales bacterium]|nr:hypothetical protein [Holophagales bacterium]